MGAPWILTFSGFHGTTQSSADDIRKRGFDYHKLKTERMFGPGIYMYNSTDEGERWAKEWAKEQVEKLTEEGIQDAVPYVLPIEVSYTEHEFLTWTNDDELALEEKLREEKKKNPAFILNRHTQNQWRLKAVSEKAQGRPQNYPVIFADFPLPSKWSNHGKNRYSGCFVRDLALLSVPSSTQAGV